LILFPPRLVLFDVAVGVIDALHSYSRSRKIFLSTSVRIDASTIDSAAILIYLGSRIAVIKSNNDFGGTGGVLL
jgi:hypothetical protein